MPVAVGVNLIEMVQVVPDASIQPLVALSGHVAVMPPEKAGWLAPERVTPPIGIISGVRPVFVFLMVTVCAALATPTAELVKVRVAGVKAAEGVPPTDDQALTRLVTLNVPRPVVRS